MTRERIEERLASLRASGRTALVVYLTIGDPDLDTSLACALAALEAGADLLELGVPFSDPTADGPTIAAASYRAIRAGGSLKSALQVAKAIRRESAAPLVLFTYLNPIVAFGEARLPKAAAEAGIDGLLVVDLPPEEGAELAQACDAVEIALIPLVAPTTSLERVARVVAGAHGFVYYVSMTGVTGAAGAPLAEAGRHAAELRERIALPVVVGFGIDSPEKARAVAASGVDGVVVGSAVVRAISAASDRRARVEAVSELVRSLRRALD